MDWFIGLPERTRAVIAVVLFLLVGLLLFGIMSMGGSTDSKSTPKPTTTSTSVPVSPTADPDPSTTDEDTSPVTITTDFNGPLPVSPAAVNAMVSKAIKTATIIENQSLSLEKKQKALVGVATPNAVAGVLGSDVANTKANTIEFVQAVSINRQNVVFELKVNGTSQYVSFIKVNGEWLANAYGGQIGVS